MLTGLWDLKRYSKLAQKAVLKITWSMSAWKLLATSYNIVIVCFLYSTLPDPDLEIRGGGVGQSFRPLEKGRGPVSKTKGGGGGSPGPPTVV